MAEYRGKQSDRRIVRVGDFDIQTDGMQYIVDRMGLTDMDHPQTKEQHEVSKRRTYYDSFESLAKGVLEQAIKVKFQESGLRKVYTDTLRQLIEQCEEKLNG